VPPSPDPPAPARAIPGFPRPAALASTLVASAVLVGSLGARAEASPAPGDRFDFWVYGESNAMLFRRALLPGPNGVLVETDMVIPIRQDVRLRAARLDSPWHPDSLDAELAVWGASIAGSAPDAQPLDGDVQVANVGYRAGPVLVRLGRQQTAGGAARYVRFDGAALDADLGGGFDASAYGGLTVLPRWNQQPGYFALGTGTDALRRDPAALPEPSRGQNWLAGGRLGWGDARARAHVSFHEQREDDGLARENLGAHGRIQVMDEVSAGGNLLLDVDARRIADGRLWLDTTPLPELDATLEFLHTEPALLLSRQSVVAVFSTSAYDELGGFVVARPLPLLALESGGWLQIYDQGHPGARGEIVARLAADRSMRSTLRVSYTRVLAPDNGYHGLRASVARRITEALTGTAEAYAYFYDEAIREVGTSTVYAAMLTWQAARALNLLAGTSVVRSPYALFDAQAQVRLAYDFDFSSRGVAPR
jgi:hypothetical protein